MRLDPPGRMLQGWHGAGIPRTSGLGPGGGSLAVSGAGAVVNSAGIDVGNVRKPVPLARAASPKLLGLAAAIALLGGAFVLAWNAAIWPLNQHSAKALERRAQYFWDLRISGDAMGAYQYMTDSYRRRVTPTGFARSGAGLVQWTKAAVKGVTLDEKGGLVDVELTYRVAKPGFKAMESTDVARERWVIEGGGWHRWPPEGG